MPSILALATATCKRGLRRPHSDSRLTIGSVEKQNGVGTTEDGNQSQVHLGRVRLLGVRDFEVSDSMVAAVAALCRRLCDEFLVVLHLGYLVAQCLGGY